MNKPHKHCELIKAWADGAEIQYREDSARMWTDIINPLWDVMFEYRIKPRTFKKEGWVNIGRLYAGYCAYGEVFASEEVARRNAIGSITTVKVEWAEEVE